MHAALGGLLGILQREGILTGGDTPQAPATVASLSEIQMESHLAVDMDSLHVSWLSDQNGIAQKRIVKLEEEGRHWQLAPVLHRGYRYFNTKATHPLWGSARLRRVSRCSAS